MDTHDATSIEVNFIETPVQLNVHFIDNEMVSIIHSDIELVIDLANTNQALEAYICDKDANVVEIDPEKTAQGVTIRVCVVPVDKVTDEGAYLKSVDQLSFYRDSVMQEADLSGTLESKATDVTFIDCPPGAQLCVFEITLESEFFLNISSTSTINGTGVAHLQIGEDGTLVNSTNTTNPPGNSTRQLTAMSGMNDSPKERRRLMVLSTNFSFELAVVPKMKDPEVSYQPKSGANALSSIVTSLVTVVLTWKLVCR